MADIDVDDAIAHRGKLPREQMENLHEQVAAARQKAEGAKLDDGQQVRAARQRGGPIGTTVSPLF